MDSHFEGPFIIILIDVEEPHNGLHPFKVGIWIYAPIQIRSIKLFVVLLMP